MTRSYADSAASLPEVSTYRTLGQEGPVQRARIAMANGPIPVGPKPPAQDGKPGPQAQEEFGAFIGPEPQLRVVGDLGPATRLGSIFAAMTLLLLLLLTWAWWQASSGP